MLLAIHSATNWLIFYKWPKCKEEKKKRFAASFTLSASSSTDLNKNTLIDPMTAEICLKRFNSNRLDICANIIGLLNTNSVQIPDDLKPDERQSAIRNSRQCFLLADIIEAVLSKLTKINYDGDSLVEWRGFCRRIGYHYHKVNGYICADEWKLIRTQLVLALCRPSPVQRPSVRSFDSNTENNHSKCHFKMHHTNLSIQHKALIRTFNGSFKFKKEETFLKLPCEK